MTANVPTNTEVSNFPAVRSESELKYGLNKESRTQGRFTDENWTLQALRGQDIDTHKERWNISACMC